MAPGRPTSGAAVASMVLGIVGIVFGCYTFGVPNLLAVVLGHIGYAATRNAQVGGRGMAVAGLVMGYLMVVPVIAVIVLGGIGALVGTGNPSPTP